MPLNWRNMSICDLTQTREKKPYISSLTKRWQHKEQPMHCPAVAEDDRTCKK